MRPPAGGGGRWLPRPEGPGGGRLGPLEVRPHADRAVADLRAARRFGLVAHRRQRPRFGARCRCGRAPREGAHLLETPPPALGGGGEQAGLHPHHVLLRSGEPFGGEPDGVLGSHAVLGKLCRQVARDDAEHVRRPLAARPVAGDGLADEGQGHDSDLAVADAHREGWLPQRRREVVREDRLHSGRDGDVGSNPLRKFVQPLLLHLRRLLGGRRCILLGQLLKLPIYARPFMACRTDATFGTPTPSRLRGAGGRCVLRGVRRRGLGQQLETDRPGKLVEGLLASLARDVADGLGGVAEGVAPPPSEHEDAAALQRPLQVAQAFGPGGVPGWWMDLDLPRGQRRQIHWRHRGRSPAAVLPRS
mmetsp:Transcript_43086/g.125368  ORF Transcript_43086/g.125368 Transcript_43086/m.125368 type:complete len:361 (-) Transcript_43086:43-1125(-)